MYKLFLIATLAITASYGQETAKDTLKTDALDNTHNFHYKQLIIPTILIGYGAIGIGSDQLISFNTDIRNEMQDDIDRKFTIDDISQYVPMVAVYGLNIAGVKGKHNLRDRTIIMGTSYILMSATVVSLKNLTKVERPDGSDFKSFPSGHTATAFAGAEFMWQEYKDVSVWYGISGYVVAAGTGYFRMYNNKHWLTDVAAGAGIGILSTKVAYWINPWVQKKIFNSTESKTITAVAPFYTGKQLGIGFMRTF